jgi:hypothetical protein
MLHSTAPHTTQDSRPLLTHCIPPICPLPAMVCLVHVSGACEYPRSPLVLGQHTRKPCSNQRRPVCPLPAIVCRVHIRSTHKDARGRHQHPPKCPLHPPPTHTHTRHSGLLTCHGVLGARQLCKPTTQVPTSALQLNTSTASRHNNSQHPPPHTPP